MRNKFLTSPFFIFLLVLVLIWLTVALGRELYNRYQIHKRIIQLEKEIEKGLSLGATDYLVKTDYSIQQIMDKIKNVLKGRKNL